MDYNYPGEGRFSLERYKKNKWGGKFSIGCLTPTAKERLKLRIPSQNRGRLTTLRVTSEAENRERNSRIKARLNDIIRI
jgi:hypothetical protein